MFGRYNSVDKIRQLEDKNLQRLETEQLRKRAAMEPISATDL